MAIIDRVMTEKIKSMLTDQIQEISIEFGIKNARVEFDSLKYFSIYLPHQEEKGVSLGFHPDFITTMTKKGFEINMIFSDKIKGQTICGTVKKQV